MKSLSRVRLFVTPWTVAYQAPPSMGFSRQEYWNGVPFPSPGDLPDPGIEPWSPAFQADTLTSEPSGKLWRKVYSNTLFIFFVFSFEFLLLLLLWKSDFKQATAPLNPFHFDLRYLLGSHSLPFAQRSPELVSEEGASPVSYHELIPPRHPSMGHFSSLTGSTASFLAFQLSIKYRFKGHVHYLITQLRHKNSP